MKIQKLIIAAAMSAVLASAQADNVKLVDRIVAVADGNIITSSQLNQALIGARDSLPKGSKINEDELRQQVLQQLINQALIVQAGQRKGIGASAAEIDNVLNRTAAHRKTTVDALYANAAKDGLSRQALRRNIADDIISQKVQQEAIMQNSQVSDAEVSNFIQQAQAKGVVLPQGEPIRQYHARHILISADTDNAAVAALSRANKIGQLARSGTDFSSLARQYSQDSGSAAQGGDLGWFSDGQMVPAFEQAVHQLKPGQVSQPVRSQFGWHIIKLDEVRDAGTAEERQRNAVRQYLVQQKMQQATQNLLQQLHDGAYIDIRQ